MSELVALPKRHFTRKHYHDIAGAISGLVFAAGTEEQEIVKRVAVAMCAMFCREYPQFDATRFMRLCALID